MRTLLRVAAVFALLAPSAAVAVAPAVAPPTLLAPVSSARLNPPFLFQWSAISPTQTFNIGVTSRGTRAGQSVVAVSYELQISDRIDVASHTLYDTIVDQTSYLFLNSQSDPSFTTNEPPNTPLVGGTYYWRVRGVFAGTASNFSRVGQFTVVGPGISSSIHALGLSAISLAGIARVGSQTLILVQVRDLGNFPENGATLNVLAGGQSIATSDVPQLNPGKQVTISAPWTPQGEGLVQISAQLQYSDDNPKAHSISQSEVVTAAVRRRTSMRGVIAESLGSYSLTDPGGNVFATLTQSRGSSVAFGLFTGQRVEVDGYLSTARGEFILEATAIKKI
jgi:hypothetical protein